MAIKTQTFIDPFEGTPQRFAATVLGMWVFLVVVAMLFLGAIMGYLVVRVNPNLEAPFIPEGATGLPVSLVFSTIALMASSYSMHQATRHVRQGRSQEAHWSMTITMLLVNTLASAEQTLHA